MQITHIQHSHLVLGRQPCELGMQNLVANPASVEEIPLDVPTIAEEMKSFGTHVIVYQVIIFCILQKLANSVRESWCTAV